MTSNITTIILGFLGCGGIAGIAYFISSKIGSASEIKEIIHKTTQKISQEKVEEIVKKQEPIKKKIEENELLSEETKNKIKEIKKESNKEIVKILKEENFENLLDQEEDLW